jgi:RHS repeat-associated protein
VTGPENNYLYNGKELQTDFDLGLHDYGARYYDAAIGRFTTIDRFAEKYYSMNPYQYGANNPISNIDINGDSVWVASRALNMPGGGAAVHTFIVARPDENNPNGDTYYLSFYEGDDGSLVGTEKKVSTGKDGNQTVETLFGDPNWNSDQEWDPEDLKGMTLIATPDGQSDGEFISGIRDNARDLDSENFEYKALTNSRNCSTNGNCNSSTSTILNNSGVSVDEIKRLDPSGFNPGIGVINKKDRTKQSGKLKRAFNELKRSTNPSNWFRN